MSVSSEEFFMYLIIALVIMLPVSARIYRYVTAKQVARMLNEEFGSSKPPSSDSSKRGQS